jgi:hypothetical protein
MTTTTAQPAKCKRCHRKLTDPRSVARGYGRTCAAKVETKVNATVATFKPAQVDKAMALIAAGGITPSGVDTFYVVKGTSAIHRTDATLCTCTAGQHGRTCYHLIAARVLDAVAAA